MRPAWLCLAATLALSGCERAPRPQVEREPVTGPTSRVEQLEVTVEAAVEALRSLESAGVRDWTAAEAAAGVVESLNTASVPVAGESEVPGPGMELRTGSPTEPWQVVLVPEAERGVVRVEGYGESLETPLVVRTVEL